MRDAYIQKQMSEGVKRYGAERKGSERLSKEWAYLWG